MWLTATHTNITHWEKISVPKNIFVNGHSLGMWDSRVTWLLLSLLSTVCYSWALRSSAQDFSWPCLSMRWAIVCTDARFRFQHQILRMVFVIVHWNKCISHIPFSERKNILEVKQHLKLGKSAWETKICPAFLHSFAKEEKQGHLKISKVQRSFSHEKKNDSLM